VEGNTNLSASGAEELDVQDNVLDQIPHIAEAAKWLLPICQVGNIANYKREGNKK